MGRDTIKLAGAGTRQALAMNADGHEIMQNFHRPGDEKRSLVIVPSTKYDAWFHCKDAELARSFMSLYPAESMDSAPAPKTLS